jgi:hypothetical protein
MSFNPERRYKRYQQKKQKQEIQRDLVSRGKKISFDKKGRPIEVNAQKPITKETN